MHYVSVEREKHLNTARKTPVSSLRVMQGIAAVVGRLTVLFGAFVTQSGCSPDVEVKKGTERELVVNEVVTERNVQEYKKEVEEWKKALEKLRKNPNQDAAQDAEHVYRTAYVMLFYMWQDLGDGKMDLLHEIIPLMLETRELTESIEPQTEQTRGYAENQERREYGILQMRAQNLLSAQ